MNIYQEWADAFASIGMSHLSHATMAQLLAVAYVYGGSSESFTHNKMLVTDLKTAQRVLKIDGAETPNADDVELIKGYVKELQLDIASSKVGEIETAICSKVCHVEWANKLFKERYGFKYLLI